MQTLDSYQSYQDVLSENATRRNVLGSSIAIILMLAAVIVAASF